MRASCLRSIQKLHNWFYVQQKPLKKWHSEGKVSLTNSSHTIKNLYKELHSRQATFPQKKKKLRVFRMIPSFIFPTPWPQIIIKFSNFCTMCFVPVQRALLMRDRVYFSFDYPVLLYKSGLPVTLFSQINVSSLVFLPTYTLYTMLYIAAFDKIARKMLFSDVEVLISLASWHF